MAAGRDPVTGRLGHGQADGRLADEPIEQADRVRAAPDAGQDEVGQTALDSLELGRRLVAQDPLEVAHDCRIGMRPHRRAQDIVGRLDVRDPVAHRLVDRVLEGGRAGGDRPDLGTQRAHPQHVGLLAPDVLGAHEHDAGQVEQGAGRGRGDAVLAGPGLGDHPRLAQPPGEQRLAQGVVDLVGPGVAEVLALEVEAQDRRDPTGRGPIGADLPAGLGQRGGRQAIGPVERGGPTGVGRQERPELGPEARIVTQGRSRPARVPRGPPSASRARSGRRTRGCSPSGRPRPPRAGRRRPASAGPRGWAGPSAPPGRAWRTAPPGADPCAAARPRPGAPRPPRRRPRPTAGIASTASPTFAGLSPPARITGSARATAAARPAEERVPVPPGCGPPAVSSRIRSTPASR